MKILFREGKLLHELYGLYFSVLHEGQVDSNLLHDVSDHLRASVAQSNRCLVPPFHSSTHLCSSPPIIIVHIYSFILFPVLFLSVLSQSISFHSNSLIHSFIHSVPFIIIQIYFFLFFSSFTWWIHSQIESWVPHPIIIITPHCQHRLLQRCPVLSPNMFVASSMLLFHSVPSILSTDPVRYVR